MGIRGAAGEWGMRAIRPLSLALPQSIAYSLGMDTNSFASTQFEAFMHAQLEAIIASGEEFEEWIEKHAEEFRKGWDADHPLEH